jgi:hypothetical protein
VRALHGLATGITDLDNLATHTGTSKSHLRRSVLPALTEAGWTERLPGRSTSITPTTAHEPLADWIVTIEAKRTAWAAAVAQARRHLRAADRAFIAIDAHHARRAVTTAPELARQGLGVATVAASSTTTCTASGREFAGVISYPNDRRPGLPAGARGPRPADHRLAAERTWELHLRGVLSGPTHLVFGRDLSA